MANLLSRVPKRSQPGPGGPGAYYLPAALTGGVRRDAQADRVVVQLREHFPQAVEVLEDASPDILAFTAFPTPKLAETVV